MNTVIEFEDKFGKERSEEEIGLIVRRIKNILKEYDFDLSYTGKSEEFFRELRERYEKIKS